MPHIQINIPSPVVDSVCETLGIETNLAEAAKVQRIKQAMTDWLRSLYVRGRAVSEEKRAERDAEQIT